MEPEQIKILEQIEQSIKQVEQAKSMSEYRKAEATKVLKQLHLIISQDHIQPEDIFRAAFLNAELFKIQAMPNGPSKFAPGGMSHMEEEYIIQANLKR